MLQCTYTIFDQSYIIKYVITIINFIYIKRINIQRKGYYKGRSSLHSKMQAHFKFFLNKKISFILLNMSERGVKNFSVVPSELRLTQKWDYAIENFITRPALGLAIGGLLSVVLFRKLI